MYKKGLVLENCEKNFSIVDCLEVSKKNWCAGCI